MTAHDLHEFVKRATDQLASEYERISKRSKEDPGTAGENGQENWAALLRNWLPSTYQIETNGRILFEDGTCSGQVDVVVLDPSYPPALVKTKEFLAGGVLAAFECKLTLRREDICKTAKNCADIQRRARPCPPTSPFRELHGNIVFGLLAHSHEWTRPKSNPIENVESALTEFELDSASHPKELLDSVCVANLCCWNSLRWITTQEMVPEEKINKTLIPPVVPGITTSKLRSIQYAPDIPFVGMFLVGLLQRIAWRDASVRPISRYFSAVLQPGGRVPQVRRHWPTDTLSQYLLRQLNQGKLKSVSSGWDEWAAFF